MAIEAARKAASRVDDETLKAVPLLAGFRVVPYYALTRFGKWTRCCANLNRRHQCVSERHVALRPRHGLLGKGQTDAAEQEFGKV